MLLLLESHTARKAIQAHTPFPHTLISTADSMDGKAELAQEHEQKNHQHHRDFDKARDHKAEVAGAKRADRHPGTGHSLNEGPKKSGGGKGNWGSIADDINEAKEEGLIH